MRGTGTTTQQMQAASRGAVYVWASGHLDYPRDLARRLGRTDLRISGPSVFEHGGERLLGIRPLSIVIDHAAHLTQHQFAVWQTLRTTVRS